MLDLGLSIPAVAARRRGSAAITLLPSTVPAPYQNASPTPPNIQNTGGPAHYAQALGNASKIVVNYVDANNYIYLDAPGGNTGFIIYIYAAGVATNLTGFIGTPAMTNADLRYLKIERLSPTSNKITATVGAVSTNVTVGTLSIGNSNSAGIVAGSSVTSFEVGQINTPLSITSATLQSNRTVDIVITYTGTPNSYEYQLNGGSWANATTKANPTAGNATITVPALSTGLNGTSPTIALRQKNLTAVTASTSVYVPAPTTYGMNLVYPQVGGNSYPVRNGMLYGEWQSTQDYGTAYTNVANPTYIGADYMPLQMPPSGFSWFHLVPFMGASGTRIRLRANSTSAAFTIGNDVALNQTTGSGGGYKWIDYDHTFSDPGTSDNGAYASLTITSLGTATTWEAYPIDGSGNAIESGFFVNQFVTDCTKFECLRFMDWQGANGNNTTTVDWPSRMTGTNWRLTNGSMPLSRMIELWQACGKDAHFCIPWKATNTYIDSFADLMAASVPTGRKVYIELANEVWNSNFPVWTVAKDEGIAGSVTESGGATPPTDHGYVLCRFAQRFAEVMARVIARFVAAGKRSQLVTVCNLQPLTGNFDYVANNYSCDTYVDTYSCSAYIGYNANNDPTNTSSVATVLSRYRTGTSVSIDSVMTAIAGMKAKANGKGKRFTCYESSVEKMTGASAALQKLVNRDADMKNVMLEFYTAFETQAGDLMCVYSDTLRITDFGGYGQQEYFYQPRASAPKYDALLTKMGL